MNPEIAILPEKLCNQIAAGEVVERPASVVKELLENALDAGASRITVEVVNGGSKAIKVSDNGRGMNKHDIFLCFERHATSKIKTEQDLFSLSSLGFRGEALPAIAAVSRFNVCSRHIESSSGMQVRLKGGAIVDAGEIGMPVGTTIEVRDLFYNLPARRKFLRKTATEFGHVADVVMRLSLAHPTVQFKLVHDDRVVCNYYSQRQVLERIGEALGRNLALSLQNIECERGDIALHGYIALPDQNRSTTQSMYTYINGRFIRDPVVKHAVLDAYRQLLMKGRYPVCVLFLEMPAAKVDVNVHPTKHEVRFHDQRMVHDFITNAVRQQLRSRYAENLDRRREVPVAYASENEDRTPPVVQEATRHDQAADAGCAQIQEPQNLYESQGDIEETSTPAPLPAPECPPWETGVKDSDAAQVAEVGTPLGVGRTSCCAAAGQDTLLANSGSFSSLRIIGQFANSFLVCEDEDGLVLIDQHAAHERIGFECLRRQYAERKVERQELLFPQMLELTQTQNVQMQDHFEQLAALGFELEHFGGTTWALKALPVLLQEEDIAALVMDLLSDFSEWGTAQSSREAIDSILIRMACHHVIRANEALAHTEMQALLLQLDQVDFNHHCPHGRPVMHRLSRHEVERFFAR